ncbi:hypothetical protein LIER_35093 [Lithospermum erythrorhizon]|uniref:Uncharacterized protein n=1 Tax=Lithospermum erythrorhizon TaxID=34254 RepID=A0AAV3NK48_LITER
MRAVVLKNSSNKKGRGRVAGINASQDSPDDISEGSRMSVSEGTRMSISQGSHMSFSQGQGQITPTSPSTPKTPTSKPPRSPTSVVERRKSSACKKNFKKKNNCPFQFLGSVVEDQFPPNMKNYINQCMNVLGDGNYGFRVVALEIYGIEDEWVKMVYTQFQYWIDQYNVLHNEDTPRRAVLHNANTLRRAAIYGSIFQC